MFRKEIVRKYEGHQCNIRRKVHVHLSWEINYAHTSTFDAETARGGKQEGTADLLRV